MSQMITVEATWRSRYQIEVPDDFDRTADYSNLSAVPQYVLEQLDASTAELVDWAIPA